MGFLWQSQGFHSSPWLDRPELPNRRTSLLLRHHQRSLPVASHRQGLVRGCHDGSLWRSPAGRAASAALDCRRAGWPHARPVRAVARADSCRSTTPDFRRCEVRAPAPAPGRVRPADRRHLDHRSQRPERCRRAEGGWRRSRRGSGDRAPRQPRLERERSLAARAAGLRLEPLCSVSGAQATRARA